MKINLSRKLLLLTLLLCSISANGWAASPDDDLPAKVKQLRQEIRKNLVRESSFSIAPYEGAKVLPEDKQMKDACFKTAPTQDKTVNRKSNADLQKESTLATDINTVIGSVADKCINYKSTAKFSPLDLNKWYLTSIVDPKNANQYYRSSGESGSLYRAETGEGGNRMKNATRLVRPDATMLNGCSTELMVQNTAGSTNIKDPVWMRRELDNCLNQYILQQGRFPRINENYKASYFGINASLCQPLKLQLPPSKYDLYEYAPSEYLGVAWKKLLVDSAYKKTTGARAEPDYANHSKVRVTKKIEMPAGTFGQILVEDLAESLKTGGEVEMQYDKILDPSHPFSPRWDYRMQDRSLSAGGQLVFCAGVPVDILTFRQGPFEQSIAKKIAFNIACAANYWCRKHNNWCGMEMGNQCCSTAYVFKDRVSPPYKKACGLPIVDGCNFIGRPITPLNTLKMREVNATNFQGGAAPEGYSFKDYFGTNKPYMRCWDSNTECGETKQVFPITGGLLGAVVGSVSPQAMAAFSSMGITNLTDINSIVSSGLSPQMLQQFAQGAGLGNLSQLAQAGLNPAALSNLGNLTAIAGIPNVANLAKLAEGGVNFNSLSSLSGLPNPLGAGNISAIASLANGNLPSNVIQQITALPTNVAGNLPSLIQSAAGDPNKLIASLAPQGVNITSGAADQMIANAQQISGAISSGNLPSGIIGGINTSQISSLQGMIAGGINPANIAANILPNAGNLGAAFSGIGGGNISSILSNPASLASLSSLGSLGLPTGQLGNVASLFGGGGLGGAAGALGGLGGGGLSAGAVGALTGASPANITGLGGALGLGGGAGGLVGGGTTKLLYNPTSIKGSNYAILGAGREGESCMIGGGKGEGGVANPDPITSWSELKLYYVRSTRMNLKCLANHEKLFKHYTGEGGLLRSAGQSIPRREKCANGSDGCYANVEMPFPWLGYLSDPKAAQRFPNFGNVNVTVTNLGKGLDDAMPNDVLVFGEDLVRTGNKATDRNPYVGVVANAENAATRRANGGGKSSSLEFVKIRAYNHGKYLDACGNTDMLGDSTVYTMFKSGMIEPYLTIYKELGNNNNVPPSYHCLDPALSACIEPLWENIPRYKIESAN